MIIVGGGWSPSRFLRAWLKDRSAEATVTGSMQNILRVSLIIPRPLQGQLDDIITTYNGKPSFILTGPGYPPLSAVLDMPYQICLLFSGTRGRSFHSIPKVFAVTVWPVADWPTGPLKIMQKGPPFLLKNGPLCRNTFESFRVSK